MGRLFSLFPPLTQLREDVDRLLDVDAGAFAEPFDGGFGAPALNTWEVGDTAFVEAELPGAKQDQIEVSVCGGELTLRGERKIADTQGATWHRRERPRGTFSRTVALPWEIQADRVQAKLTDGVLTVTLPKSERSRARKVNVLSS
jgi:HSP20 family protein